MTSSVSRALFLSAAAATAAPSIGGTARCGGSIIGAVQRRRSSINSCWSYYGSTCGKSSSRSGALSVRTLTTAAGTATTATTTSIPGDPLSHSPQRGTAAATHATTTTPPRIPPSKLLPQPSLPLHRNRRYRSQPQIHRSSPRQLLSAHAARPSSNAEIPLHRAFSVARPLRHRFFSTTSRFSMTESTEWPAARVRKTFFDHFAERGHTIGESQSY